MTPEQNSSPAVCSLGMYVPQEPHTNREGIFLCILLYLNISDFSWFRFCWTDAYSILARKCLMTGHYHKPCNGTYTQYDVLYILVVKFLIENSVMFNIFMDTWLEYQQHMQYRYLYTSNSSWGEYVIALMLEVIVE